MNPFRTLLIIFCLCVALLTCRAADTTAVVRPVYAAYAIEAGSAHIAETYLSPLKYSGWNVALSYERMQAMRFDPERWVMQLNGRLSGAHTNNNPARNATIWNLNLDLRWAMMRRFRFGRWGLFAGGATGIDAGMLYAPRNSNNPVAAKASWTVDIAAAATYQFSAGRLPICLRYQAFMPLTGVFFAPAYGELYYEIYLGNRKGLAHGAWPGNYFRLNNLLTADLRFRGCTLRLGYRLNVSSSKASSIVTRRVEHMATVGVAGEWISISPNSNRSLINAKKISALY